jgi:hypothetical protein
MDTKEAAELLGTTPRTFRQFLRSPISTYQAVGSGARYEFTDKDIPTLVKRFTEWTGAGKPKPEGVKPRTTPKPSRKDAQVRRDEAVWAEEPVVVIEDIRDPRVRARVKADAHAAETRLTLALLAKGLHITQRGNR